MPTCRLWPRMHAPYMSDPFEERGIAYINEQKTLRSSTSRVGIWNAGREEPGTRRGSAVIATEWKECVSCSCLDPVHVRGREGGGKGKLCIIPQSYHLLAGTNRRLGTLTSTRGGVGAEVTNFVLSDCTHNVRPPSFVDDPSHSPPPSRGAQPL